jgi:glycosyltransferase involved in cell wall biosynthesis
MSGAVTVILGAFVALPTLLTLAFAMQALGMIFKRSRQLVLTSERPRIAVMVPAHDEAQGIAATVKHLRQNLEKDDLLLVIADNCSDDTAALAKASGAQVLMRIDDRRGKGYALAHGLETLSSLAHDVVIFIDADCRVEAGGLDRLARACHAADAPIQARYMMIAQPGQSRLAEFFWRIRNDFRPEGYARFGLPCPLFGSGMALPVTMAKPHLFATGHVTEDLLIGIRSALARAAPHFMREVTVTSAFAWNSRGEDQQRRRWIHGHLDVIRSSVLPLLRAGLRTRNGKLFAMGLDVLTPPLSMLAAAHGAAFGLAGLYAFATGQTGLLTIASAGFVMFMASMLAAWWISGRDLVGKRELLDVPRHLRSVLRSVLAFLSGNRSGWVRADRSRGA